MMMYQKTTVREVLGRVSSHFGCKTDHDLGRVFGVANNTISGWSQRETIPYKYLHDISIKEKISMDTLLYGDELTPEININLFLRSLNCAQPNKFDEMKSSVAMALLFYNNAVTGKNQEERCHLVDSQAGLIHDLVEHHWLDLIKEGQNDKAK